ncbi:MAG: nicotinic acid mononucleotide adenylyltransferase [Planctomycetota bacterium]|nr:MAG: nicotinic acid mononucleotide adenylyltransferase [Planctomycetota bacterium]
MAKKRIGILGGTFDPVHLGHLIVAEDLREDYGLSRLVFVPARIPPHKAGVKITPAGHRLAMLQLAVRGRRGLGVSDIELKRRGKSYTIDTIREFRKYIAAEYFFFAGTDSIQFLPKWKEVDSLMRECKFVLMVRPGFPLDQLSTVAESLSPAMVTHLQDNLTVVRQVDISSTEIRERVRAGLSISHLVPASVARYVTRHRLYRR